MAEQRDLVAEVTGQFGKWQLKAVLIIFLCKIPTSWFMAVILYSAPAPQNGDFWCRPPEHLANHSQWNRTLAMHPMVDDQQIDYCQVYREIYEPPVVNGTSLPAAAGRRNQSDVVPCEEFVFNVDFHSVIVEFGLVCGRKLLSAFAQSFHILGLLIGGVIANYLLRMYGTCDFTHIHRTRAF